jgi:hypothetical protein
MQNEGPGSVAIKKFRAGPRITIMIPNSNQKKQVLLRLFLSTVFHVFAAGRSQLGSSARAMNVNDFGFWLPGGWRFIFLGTKEKKVSVPANTHFQSLYTARTSSLAARSERCYSSL